MPIQNQLFLMTNNMSNQEKIINVMSSWTKGGDYIWWGYNSLSEETGLSIKELKSEIKKMLKEKIVINLPTVNLDTGMLNGSGYFLSELYD